MIYDGLFIILLFTDCPAELKQLSPLFIIASCASSEYRVIIKGFIIDKVTYSFCWMLSYGATNVLGM